MSAAVVQLARNWIGTPYLHQASVKGAGCDCLGLLRGIWRELGQADPAALPDYPPDWGQIGPREVLLDGLSAVLIPAQQEQVGDVLVFRMREGAIAKHLGILARNGAEASFIHAYERHGVIESPLSAPWRRKIAARFRFPNH